MEDEDDQDGSMAPGGGWGKAGLPQPKNDSQNLYEFGKSEDVS